jgi:hypothetical protein
MISTGDLLEYQLKSSLGSRPWPLFRLNTTLALSASVCTAKSNRFSAVDKLWITPRDAPGTRKANYIGLALLSSAVTGTATTAHSKFGTGGVSLTYCKRGSYILAGPRICSEQGVSSWLMVSWNG